MYSFVRLVPKSAADHFPSAGSYTNRRFNKFQSPLSS